MKQEIKKEDFINITKQDINKILDDVYNMLKPFGCKCKDSKGLNILDHIYQMQLNLIFLAADIDLCNAFSIQYVCIQSKKHINEIANNVDQIILSLSWFDDRDMAIKPYALDIVNIIEIMEDRNKSVCL